MKAIKIKESFDLYKLCLDIHDYLEKNKKETLFIPSISWWQEQKQWGLVKRISKLSKTQKLNGIFELREFYSSTFIRNLYHIRKK